MKQLILSILFSVVVGLPLMASPAEVCDGNDVQRKGTEAVVTQRPEMPRQNARPYHKFDVKVKKIDLTKLPAPKRVAPNVSSSLVQTKQGLITKQRLGFLERIIHFGPVVLPDGIPKNPFPPKDGQTRPK